LIQNRLIGLSDTKILKVDSALLQKENNMVIISSSFNNKLYLRDFISTSLVGQDDKIIINAMFPIIFGIKKNRN